MLIQYNLAKKVFIMLSPEMGGSADNFTFLVMCWISQNRPFLIFNLKK